MKLAEWMKAAGLSDQDVAIRARCTRSTITRVRRGTHPPSNKLMRKIVAASDGKVSANELLNPDINAP